MKTLALLVPALLAGACASDDGSSPITRPEPQQHMGQTSNPSFTLYVSNQSLDRDLVDMHIYIDNQLAVSGDFDVYSGHSGEGCGGPRIPQHNWYEFKFALSAGTHTIRIESEDTTVTTTADVSKKFGVAMYWYDVTTDQPEEFSFFEQADQPYFD